MANPTLLDMPIARDGNKNAIPTTDNGTTGRLSQQYGWQLINAIPPQQGGKAVKREDFNGALYLLSNLLFYLQKGWQFEWNSSQAYYAGCVVKDTDGGLYCANTDVSASSTHPKDDAVHWSRYNSYALRSHSYNVGGTSSLPNIPAGYFLECTTAGTTGATAPVITPPVSAKQTISDGTVVWTVRQCFPTSGGALLGDIYLPTDNARMRLTGASTETTGAEFFLSGVDYVNPTLPAGSFLLQACDGVNFPYLRGTPDGKLVWAGNSLDLATVTAIDTGVNGYVKFKSGYMIASGTIETGGALTGEVIYPVSFSSAVMVGGTYYRATPKTFSITGYDNTKFNWTRESNQYSIRWVAVGK